jgi:predicted ATP-dependent protease
LDQSPIRSIRRTLGSAFFAAGFFAAGFFVAVFFAAGFLLEALAEVVKGMLRAREEMSPSTKTLRKSFCIDNPFELVSLSSSIRAKYIDANRSRNGRLLGRILSKSTNNQSVTHSKTVNKNDKYWSTFVMKQRANIVLHR